METGRITFAPGQTGLSGPMEISGNTIVTGRQLAEPETPQVERITAMLAHCADSFEDALRRLAARIDRLDGGAPPQASKGMADRPSRAGQLGIIEDYAESMFSRIGDLCAEVGRLERM